MTTRSSGAAARQVAVVREIGEDGSSAVSEGKVRVNGIRAQKPSRLVHQGDVVTAMVVWRLEVLRVAAIAVRRGPPAAAFALYEDLTPEPAPTLDSGLAKATRERGRGRPSATAAGSMPFAPAES